MTFYTQDYLVWYSEEESSLTMAPDMNQQLPADAKYAFGIVAFSMDQASAILEAFQNGGGAKLAFDGKLGREGL